MNSIYSWFQGNLDVVFFVYGLSFLVMGLVILVQSKDQSTFGLGGIIWLFAAYALMHAPADFLDMWGVIRGKNHAIYVIGQLLTLGSYCLLFEFGRRLLGLVKKTFPPWVLIIILGAVAVASILSADFWTTANITIGYFIRFPAGIAAGLGLILYYRFEEGKLRPLNVKKYFFAAAFTILAWAFFCGIVRAKGAFPPAHWLNADSFLSAVKIPVYVFRAACALIVGWLMFGILRIFRTETVRKLREEVELQKLAAEAEYKTSCLCL